MGISYSSKLYFKVRVFWKNTEEVGDPMAIHLMCVQLRSDVLAGRLPLNSESDVLQVVGFHLQAVLGDYEKKKHSDAYECDDRCSILLLTLSIRTGMWRPTSRPAG